MNESEKRGSSCPFCRGDMEEGAVFGDRFSLKWVPAQVGLDFGIWAFGGEAIGSQGFLKRPRAEGARCTVCRKIVIDY